MPGRGRSELVRIKGCGLVGIGWFPMIEVHAAPVSYGNLESCHAGTVATEREERRDRYR